MNYEEQLRNLDSETADVVSNFVYNTLMKKEGCDDSYGYYMEKICERMIYVHKVNEQIETK